MKESEFSEYIEVLVHDYAEENVKAGYWDPSDALERSRKATMELLPQGINTPNHYIFVVRNGEQRVGVIWMRATLDAVIKSGLFLISRLMKRGAARDMESRRCC